VAERGRKQGGRRGTGNHGGAANRRPDPEQLVESMLLAEAAAGHLERNEVAQAVRAAARATSLDPGSVVLAQLHLAAAQRSRNMADELRALEHLATLLQTDARIFARLAYLRLRSGRLDDARQAVDRARDLLPARMRERRQWLALIEHVELNTPLPRGRAPVQPQAKRPERKAPKPERAQARVEPSRGRTSPGKPRKKAAIPARKQREVLAVRARPQPPDPVRPAPAGADPAQPVDGELEMTLDIAAHVEGIDVLSSRTFADPADVALVALAARIRDAESYHRLFALDHARGLLPFSHQEETVRRVLSVFLGRALLADEVGLGKTIEAGLILSEYLLRGRVENALVLTPPSLVAQWREELDAKFGIVARTTDDAESRSHPDRFWGARGTVIASLATARSPRHRDLVTARPWDLVIVDEAHSLKNERTESWRLVSRITSRFLLLLTATPVESRIDELYNLVSLIRPGHLGGRAAFVKRLSDSKGRPTESARAEVRALLGEIMIRNTRALSGVRLPPRFARTILVTPDASESELYAHLASALRALGARGRSRLLLSVLLQEAGSSPFAVRATLEKIRGDDALAPAVRAALEPAIRRAAQPLTTGKAAALLRVLDGDAGSTVVFTRFRATLDFLAAVLARKGIACEPIDGNVAPALRNDAIARLREQGGVLLSTEVGAEGLNLQFCRRIVNFDLPWNPMRIEQRIGRVHRIGQDHPVDVVNFCLAGSIEERILQILDERINLFELVVGETEMILGYLEEDREFPDLVLDAFAHPEDAARERSFARIGDALAAARTRYENVKRFDEDFFRSELGV